MHVELDRLPTYRILLIVGLIYPLTYQLVQMKNEGISYFTNPFNLIDFVFIYTGLANLILVFTPAFSDSTLPVQFTTQVLMLLVILCSIPKTFLFLRVFGGLSYIVTMLVNVISDLKVFLLFYTILIFMFSQFLTILGLGNCAIDITKIPGNEDAEGFMQQNSLKDANGAYTGVCDWGKDDGVPGSEYQFLGMFVGNIMSTFRMSLGDFDFDASQALLPHINIIFWVIWLLIVVITNIIFLNFIIAEASESYAKVNERLDEFILKERAGLITESEEMTIDSLKKKHLFPKYIIIRTIDR